MRVAIVEDNKFELNKLLGCFRQYEQDHNIQIDIITFNNGLEFINHYCNNFDVIYFDVQMPEMDGMTAAKKIRKIDSDVIIVFVTNYVQYAIEGYEVNAADFLLKPVNYFSFNEHFKKIEKRFLHRTNSMIFDTLEGTYKILLDDLYYVESEKHYLHLHIIQEKELQLDILDSTKNMEQKLVPYDFFRCNNGYIVNLKHVSQINGNLLKVGPYQLQISRPRKKAFMQAFTNYLGNSIN